MLVHWYDIDREMAALNELQRRITRAFGNTWTGRSLPSALPSMARAWPLANLHDNGSSLTAVMAVPGLTEKDISVEVHGDALTVSGERKSDAPEGYRVHRSERGISKFSRSFGLPCRVDAEKTTASLANGLLTITMEKHADSQPRQITVSVE